VCVTASPPDEDHQLPGVMATAALREDHWQVHHVGVHVPAEEIGALAEAVHADMIVLSVTYSPAVAAAEMMVQTLSGPGRRVLVGRPGLTLHDLVVLARVTRAES
jgi:methylmalonyl-CoA mutase cobalamin-binding subunit